MAAAAAAFPNWMMLDRFVFRRDDPETFPDDKAASLAVSSASSQGDPFRVALHIAEPPGISRFYVQWPGGLDPDFSPSCDLVTAHGDAIVFKLVCRPVAVEGSPLPHIQLDCFLCRASPSSSPPLLLKRIPMCTQPEVIRVKKNGTQITMPRPFYSEILGLLRRGEDEFAMAQLQVPARELCVLRSRLSNDDHDHKWEVLQNMPIRCGGEGESSDLFYWATDAVIPFGKYLCWVDYSKGGTVFCDVFEEMPEISYLRLPIEDRPPSSNRQPFLDRKRSVCVAEGGLKFINVSRDDGELLGPMEPGTGFTITSHVLKISESGGNMEWQKDFSIASEELWACNSPERLPRCALMYPVVSMDRPHLLHFLLSEYEDWYSIEKVSRVTIDISTNAVVSVLPYIGQEDQSDEDADMVELRSRFLQSFLPSEFPKFLNATRKRKNQA